MYVLLYGIFFEGQFKTNHIWNFLDLQPLHLASWGGHENVVRELLNEFVDKESSAQGKCLRTLLLVKYIPVLWTKNNPGTLNMCLEQQRKQVHIVLKSYSVLYILRSGWQFHVGVEKRRCFTYLTFRSTSYPLGSFRWSRPGAEDTEETWLHSDIPDRWWRLDSTSSGGWLRQHGGCQVASGRRCWSYS